MKVIVRVEKREIYNNRTVYSCYLTFNIIDKETSLVVRTRTGLLVECDESEMIDKVKKCVSSQVEKLQTAIREDKIKELYWTDIALAKRLKKVFYAVQEEFMSDKYELFLNYNKNIVQV